MQDHPIMSKIPSPLDAIDPQVLLRFRERFGIPPTETDSRTAIAKGGTELQIGTTYREDTLERICVAFSAVPFENLTKIIKNSVTVASEKKKRLPGEVLRDFLSFGTGGTCFSLNAAFISILRIYGYEAYPLLCDRHYGPNTHCAVLLIHDGSRFVVDPGYLMYRPVRIPSHITVTVPNRFNDLVLEPKPGRNRVDLFTIMNNQKKHRLTYKVDIVDDSTFLHAWEDSFKFNMMTYPVLTYCRNGTHLYLQGNVLRIRTADSLTKEILEPEELHDFIVHQSGIHGEVFERALGAIPNGTC